MALTGRIGIGLLGLILGVTLGYLIWWQQNARLGLQLAQTKAWLVDEIQRTDRQTKPSAPPPPAAPVPAQTPMQAQLRETQALLTRARAVLKEAQADWLAEVQRRKRAEERLHATENRLKQSSGS